MAAAIVFVTMRSSAVGLVVPHQRLLTPPAGLWQPGLVLIEHGHHLRNAVHVPHLHPFEHPHVRTAETRDACAEAHLDERAR